jgi:hypothetical protein
MKVDKSQLAHLYLTDQLSCGKIAIRLGVAPSTIRRWLSEYSIPVRSLREAKLANPVRYWLGKHRSLESIKRMEVSALGKHCGARGPNIALSRAVKRTYELGRKPVRYWLGKKRSVQTREKILALWQNQDWRENVLKKSLRKRPTSLERDFINIIQQHGLPFLYTGDGSQIIGFKNPDFVHTGGKPICVETANYYHHRDPWAENRVKYFTGFGWECVILWSGDKRGTKVAITDDQLSYLAGKEVKHKEFV